MALLPSHPFKTTVKAVAAIFGTMMLVGLVVGNVAADDSETRLKDVEIKRLTEAAESAIQRGESDLVWRYKIQIGDLLAARSDRKSLLNAADICRSALSFVSRESSPMEWARTQTLLGDVMYNVGTRFKWVNEVQQAVSAYRAALGEYSAEHTPAEWVAIQGKLGDALSYVALRGRIEKYEEAIAAWRAVLKIKTKDKSRTEWAETQFKIGGTYFMRGEFHDKGTESLEAAIHPLNVALEVYTSKAMPLQWGTVQSLLGKVHYSLGMRRLDRKSLETAITHLEKAKNILGQAGQASMVDYAGEEIAEIKSLLASNWGNLRGR